MSTIVEQSQEGHPLHGDQHEGQGNRADCARNVEIHVNSRNVALHPGHYTIPTLKRVSNVPLSDDLDELVDCALVPLPDDGHVTIRGCEIFVSHVKDGGSA